MDQPENPELHGGHPWQCSMESGNANVPGDAASSPQSTITKEEDAIGDSGLTDSGNDRIHADNEEVDFSVGENTVIESSEENADEQTQAPRRRLSTRTAGFGNFIRAVSEGTSYGAESGCILRLQRLLEDTKTQSVSAALVLLTVLLICLDTDRRAKGAEVSLWQEAAMAICLVAYLIEFLLTMVVQGFGAVRDTWTYIDLLVILTSLADYVVTIAFGESSLVLRLFRAGRLLRLGKLFRSLKLLQHIAWLKEQYIMCMMMASCFRTLCFALALAFFVLTLWSVLAVELLNDTVQHIATSTNLFDGCERCSRSFASIWEANWTLFQTIISGDSWGLVALPVIEEVWWSAFIFVGSFTSIVLGLLTLIPAVVIDTFAERRANDTEAIALLMEHEEVKEKSSLQKMFNKIDEDGSGALDLEEVHEGATKVPEFRQYLRVLDIDANDLTELFYMLDADGSGEVDPDEFISALYRLKHTESKTATRMVQHMIRSMKDNHINLEDRLENVQAEVRDKLALLEGRLVKDLTYPEMNSKSMDDLLNEHTSRMDEVIHGAIKAAASATFDNVIKGAPGPDSRRQVSTPAHVAFDNLMNGAPGLGSRRQVSASRSADTLRNARNVKNDQKLRHMTQSFSGDESEINTSVRSSLSSVSPSPSLLRPSPRSPTHSIQSTNARLSPLPKSLRFEQPKISTTVSFFNSKKSKSGKREPQWSQPHV